jgi:cytochrome c-type biogenesis protein CcmE
VAGPAPGADVVALAAGRRKDVAVADPPVVVAPVRRRRNWLGSRRRQVIAGLVIAGALAFLLFEGLSNATVYFKTADQAVAQRAQLGTREFRVEGTVLDDVRNVDGKVQFSITANGVTVPVVSSESPSQLFKPGIPVVLDGHWQGTVFQGSHIMVKHTASYVEAHPDRVKQ